jgi:NAD(P)H-nitrite reductase large subunit
MGVALNLESMDTVENMKKKTERVRPATFSPYIHGGTVTVDELSALVESLKASGAKKAKLTGELIFVFGGAELPGAVKENVKWEANNFKASNVRPVRTCSAEVFCQNFQQPVLGLAGQIDAKFRGKPLPAKLVIGMAGCKRSCSEPATKDIGIIAVPRGYEILAGGAAGMHPMLATSLGVVPTAKDVLKVIEKIIAFLGKGTKNRRLGHIMEKMGLDDFKESAGIKNLFIGKDDGRD